MADNGHETSVDAEMDLEAPQPEARNGGSPKGGAGLEEALGLDRRSGGQDWKFDVAKELLRVSYLPEESLARSVFGREEALIRSLEDMDLFEVRFGWTNLGMVNWKYDAIKPNIGGERVKMILKAIGVTSKESEEKQSRYQQMFGGKNFNADRPAM